MSLSQLPDLFVPQALRDTACKRREEPRHRTPATEEEPPAAPREPAAGQAGSTMNLEKTGEGRAGMHCWVLRTWRDGMGWRGMGWDEGLVSARGYRGNLSSVGVHVDVWLCSLWEQGTGETQHQPAAGC